VTYNTPPAGRKPVDDLQRQWDATPHALRQQFVETNAVELRDLLAIAAKKARDAVADRAVARSQVPAPPPSDRWADYPDFPPRIERKPKGVGA
jgi:hypothetical protein